MAAVATAAETLTRELETLTDWELDLVRDLSDTRARRAHLLKSLDALLVVLAEDDRRPLRLRLNRLAVRLAGESRANIHMTDKVEAVHDYLARAEGEVETSGNRGFPRSERRERP